MNRLKDDSAQVPLTDVLEANFFGAPFNILIRGPLAAAIQF
jgi:hypothetical protein